MINKQNNLIKQYKNVSINTASQKQLLIMLYNKAIILLEEAQSNFKYSKFDIVNNNLIKVQEILNELMISLETAKEKNPLNLQMSNLYKFMIDKLIYSNMKKDYKEVEYVKNNLKNILETIKNI